MKTHHFDICMIGLGPVGLVSGACFARQGFKVIGVDTDAARLEACARAKGPFAEPGLDELLAEVIKSGLFTVSGDAADAISCSRIIMIAVGTPPLGNGFPDLRALDEAAKTIGKAIAKGSGTPVVIRSTVPPGTARNRLSPLIAAGGLKPEQDFHMAANPEFLRRGKAIKDFFQPSRVVIGADDAATAGVIEALYREAGGKRIRTDIETAEFAKYVDNSWHALKVAFANEIGRAALAFGGSPEETARIFLADDKLNISSRYLAPGAPFGGSCLPKDVQALSHFARTHGVSLPVIDAILGSNDEQIRQGASALLATGAKTIGLLGVTFKPGVDDVRSSPALAIAEQLRQKGITVLAHDFSIASDSISLPSGGRLAMVSLEELAQAECLALFHDIAPYRALLDGKKSVDLTKVVQISA